MIRNFKEDAKPPNEIKAVMVSRLLTRENQKQLLEWAYLACVAENSVRNEYVSELKSGDILPGQCRCIPVKDIS